MAAVVIGSCLLYYFNQTERQAFVGSAVSKGKTYNVRYEVTGSARNVDVTYANATGGTEQEGKVKVPWVKSFVTSAGSFLYVSAQNQGSRGSVTVTIYRDGAALKTSTSSGAYVIADANATL